VLAGCGGGGGGGGGAAGSSAAATSYAFVTPALGAQQVYAQTVIDNSSNTILETVRDTVTAVHADGSFDYVQDDPTGNSVTVNGTLYAITTETLTVSNAGETESTTYTPTGFTSPLTCVYATGGVSARYPHSVGQSWNFTYTVTCAGYAPSTYSQVGSVVDVESVTVAAGTFTALKTLNTLTGTNASGTTTTQTITTWRDTVTSLVVKRTTSYSYSGTQPVNGYPVLVTLELQRLSS
jgi:hypothetical protein